MRQNLSGDGNRAKNKMTKYACNKALTENGLSVEVDTCQYGQKYTHQDSNLKPSVPKTDALSSCAMGAFANSFFIENECVRQLPLPEVSELLFQKAKQSVRCLFLSSPPPC